MNAATIWKVADTDVPQRAKFLGAGALKARFDFEPAALPDDELLAHTLAVTAVAKSNSDALSPTLAQEPKKADSDALAATSGPTNRNACK